MDNIETKQIKDKKAGRDWNKSVVIFFFLPIILTVLFPLGGIFYLCGRFSPSATLLATNFCMIYPLTIGFIVYCFFSGFVRLIRNWGKLTKNKRLIIVSEICIPVMFIAILTAHFIAGFQDKFFFFDPFMYGFRDRIKGKVDVKAIQDWMKTLGKEDLGTDLIHREKWPESVKVLKPVVVVRWINDIDENYNLKRIRLICGGGGVMGSWGVTVELNNTAISSPDSNQLPEYMLPLEPGAYVWSSE